MPRREEGRPLDVRAKQSDFTKAELWSMLIDCWQAAREAISMSELYDPDVSATIDGLTDALTGDSGADTYWPEEDADRFTVLYDLETGNRRFGTEDRGYGTDHFSRLNRIAQNLGRVRATEALDALADQYPAVLPTIEEDIEWVAQHVPMQGWGN